MANEILNIDGIECYEQDGTAYLKLEAVARGLGFTDVKDGNEYIRWNRVEKYLTELNFATCGETSIVNCFIPENSILPPCHESEEWNSRSVSGKSRR